MPLYTLSVVIPCLNERSNLTELVLRIQTIFKRLSVKGELVLVNDASTDDSAMVMELLCSRYPNITVIHHKSTTGIHRSWLDGVMHARGLFVALIDADMQYAPEDIGSLYTELVTTEVDIVHGCRVYAQRYCGFRFLISRVFSALLNIFFGMRLKDNKSGFLICRKSVLLDILQYRFSYFYAQTFVMIAAFKKRYRIHEKEVFFDRRLMGSSFLGSFPLRAMVLSWVDLIKAIVEFNFLIPVQLMVLKRKRTGVLSASDTWRRVAHRTLVRWYGATMPLHHWTISRRSIQYYYDLEKTQWMSAHEIHDFQLQKLRTILLHAYQHTSHYRSVFNALKLHPLDIKKISDLGNLPFLEKETIRQNLYSGLLADNHRKREIVKLTTSGSTSEPLSFFVDRHQLEMRFAATLRGMEWTGYRFGDRYARLWHQTINLTWSQILREQVDSFFSNRLFIPAFQMSDAAIRKYLRVLSRFKPELMDGYADSFYLLARTAQADDFRKLRVNAVLSSASNLALSTRKLLKEYFGCEVFDKYGSREFSGIAYECPDHAGYHVVAENYIVEIVKNGRPALPGEVGEVIITDLNNYCFPFIRYRIGDLAIAVDNTVSCACGRELPKIGVIFGRTQTLIRSYNGVYMPGLFFAHLLKDFDYMIKKYEIEQLSITDIVLRVVPNTRFQHGDFQKKVTPILKKYLGSQVVIRIFCVDALSTTNTGKYMDCISRLDYDFQRVTCVWDSLDIFDSKNN